MNVSFSRSLSLLRQEKKLSQRQVAKELGVSQALLSHYENGVREPGLDFIVRACEFYNISADFLLGRTMAREMPPILLEKPMPPRKGGPEEPPGVEFHADFNLVLLTNCLGIIFSLLDKTKDGGLVTEVTTYFSAAIYKLVRYLFRAAPSYSEDFFSVPEKNCAQGADACIKLAELGIISGINKLSEDKRIPEISNEQLKKEFPTMYPSLLEVLHKVGEEICVHSKGHRQIFEEIHNDRAQ